MSYNSGLVTADVTGNIVSSPTTIPTGASLVVKSATTSGVSTTDVYTVTAGKTLYIMAAWICAAIGSFAENPQQRLTADVLGDGVYASLCGVDLIGAGGVVASDSNSVSYSILVTVPATKKVQLSSGAAHAEVAGGFIGYEL